ncbi:bifunctional adenosylcobinamide kinase/adenosylcobinamide-phosphate guanylyltransferase [Bacillus andreraoultii]|uniref:bifunctional adenosylcobinamide kinase/adenosylcobinamide-phosphate guanylyltransferase n=1 Tax=Bacillus andreraoultii TaxID=1499685 RepID=UPI000539EC0E|nr:bifunctional adenosylcobinamide kinase/adenosylcobinamide-phosphate guanylyltransferase [Bacillus andreraoultii]
MASQLPIIFVTGGVRSGKSGYAEELAEKWWITEPKGKLHYIATMQVTDSELETRISHHQLGRKESGLPWYTWEKPTSIGELANHFSKNDTVLLDCLTTWLNNELLVSGAWQNGEFRADLLNKMWCELQSIASHVNKLIIVSNEVLSEPIATNELVLFYCELLGKLHQQIVRYASQAILVEVGIPVYMKGREGI